MSDIATAVVAADAIPGWMTIDELTWLAEQAASRMTIVEVGSYQGRSTKALAMMTDGVVYSVDSLVGEYDLAETGGALDALFREHLVDEIDAGKVRVWRMPSHEAAAGFREHADMVFIDGDHRAGPVLEDIAAWRPKLAPGGLLCGHDRMHPGVGAALARLNITGRGPGSIWIA
jgi:predicted O-methyltransferase YrrM